uniref:GerW family sporulation protein n=1 Tax=Anaerotruncus massiliensis (ex Liu et al. 2021) TaxID=2321404 RepID=UPI003AF6F082
VGAGGGVSVQPLAFLVIKDGRVDLLQMNDNKTTADRVVSMAPEVIDKLGALFQKKEKPAREAKTAGDDPQAGTEIHIDL